MLTDQELRQRILALSKDDAAAEELLNLFTTVQTQPVTTDHILVQALKAMPDVMIIVFDVVAVRNLYMNRAAEIFNGVASGEGSNPSFRERVHPDDLPKVITHNQQWLNGNTSPARITFRFKNAAGEYRWLNMHEQVYKQDADGKVLQTLVVATDITDHEHIRARLEERQHFVDRILKIAPEVVYVYDIESGSDIYYNRSSRVVLGYPEDYLQGSNEAFAKEIIHPDNVDIFFNHYHRYAEMSDQDVLEFENRVKHANGAWLSFHVREMVFNRDESGTPTQILGFVQDQTDQKRLQERLTEQEILRVALQKERELNDLKNKMMIRIAHEFRTPLAIIMTSASLLTDHADKLTPEKRQGRMERIQAQITHITDMLDDLALLMDGQNDQLELRPAYFVLADLCKSVCERVKSRHPREIKLHVAPEVHHIRADRSLVEVALFNLLTNAAKYSPLDSPIQVEIVRDKSNCLVRVIDHGVGVPKGETFRIFEPFYRGSNNDEVSGLGLGLSIVNMIAHLHEGRVTVESVPPQPTVFTLMLTDVIRH